MTYDQILMATTGGRFPRGMGFPYRKDFDGKYYIVNSIEEIKELIHKHNGIRSFLNVYAMAGQYDQTVRESHTAIIDTVPLDFDDANDPNNSLIDLKKLLKWCKKQKIKPRTQYSGSKGFHAFLDCEPVKLKYPKDALKLFTETMMREAGFTTLVTDAETNEVTEVIDTTIDPVVIGDLERIIRIPDTIHEKTGRYCITLDAEEIPYLELEDIIAMAKHKSTFIPERHPSMKIHELLKMFDSLVEQKKFEAEEEMKLIKKMREDDPLQDLFVPIGCAAYKHFMENGASSGLRDHVMCGIIHHCKKHNMSEKEIVETLKEFSSKCYDAVTKELTPLTLDEINVQVKKHMQRKYSYCTYFSKVCSICRKDCERGKRFL